MKKLITSIISIMMMFSCLMGNVVSVYAESTTPTVQDYANASSMITKGSDNNKTIEKGSLIKIDGSEYRILSVDGTKIKVLAMTDATSTTYNTSKTSNTTAEFDGTTRQKYAGSNLDTYLNDTYYNSLSFKDAIVAQNIDQDMWYLDDKSSDANYTTVVSGTYDTSNTAYSLSKYKTTLNVGNRYVYVLSVQEVLEYLGAGNLNMANINTMFFKSTASISNFSWLRSADACSANYAFIIAGTTGRLSHYYVDDSDYVRPAFVIDLSKLAYVITKETSTNGEFTVSANVSELGKDIIIIPSPSAGYEVDKVEWKRTSDSSYTIIQNNSGYKFAMPAEDVSVKVSFKASRETTTISALGGVKVPSVGNVTPPDGSTEVTVLTKDDFSADLELPGGWYVIDAGEGNSWGKGTKSVKFTNDSNIILKSGAINIGGLYGKNSDVRITIWETNSSSGKISSINRSNNESSSRGIDVKSLTVNGGTVSAKSEKAIGVGVNADTVTLNGGELIATGQVCGIFTSNFVYNGGLLTAKSTNRAISTYTINNNPIIKAGSSSSSANDTSYTGQKYVKITPSYTITKTSTTNGSFTVSEESATKDTLIIITPTANDGYEVDTVSVKDADNNVVTVTNNKFTMPESNVTVSVTFKAKEEKKEVKKEEDKKEEKKTTSTTTASTTTVTTSAVKADDTVTILSDNTAAIRAKDITTKWVNIPTYVTVGGKKYAVSTLKKDCLNGANAKVVVIREPLRIVEAEAFSGDKKLNQIIIASKQLDVSTEAFKGLKKKQLKKIKVKVYRKMSKKNFNKLKKQLVKAGLKASNIKRK